jgi:uncharacterized protein (TIGR02594 family)
MRVIFLSLLLLAGCSVIVETPPPPDPVLNALRYIGFSEISQRYELSTLTGIDPVHTQWCAAFVNSILAMSDIPGSETVSDNPLTARSFLKWGKHVEPADIQRGDIVVFPRGRSSIQGHVGFYIETRIIDGYPMYVILGGNQDNTVNYDLFTPSTALDIRRYVFKEEINNSVPYGQK